MGDSDEFSTIVTVFISIAIAVVFLVALGKKKED